MSRSKITRLVLILGLLNIFFAGPINALEKIDNSSRREWSKKHALSLFEGSVQSCPEPGEAKTAIACSVLKALTA